MRFIILVWTVSLSMGCARLSGARNDSKLPYQPRRNIHHSSENVVIQLRSQRNVKCTRSNEAECIAGAILLRPHRSIAASARQDSFV